MNGFRELVQNKMCKFWTNPEGLGSVVSRGIVNLKKQRPAVGWVRGDMVPSEDTSKEILSLKREIENLKKELEEYRTKSPIGTEDLAQGEDLFKVTIGSKANIFRGTAEFSWNEIIRILLPKIRMNKSRPEYLNGMLKESILRYIYNNKIQKMDAIYGGSDLKISEYDYETIMIHLVALGLIERREDDWFLTPYGENTMVKLMAIKKVDMAKSNIGNIE